MSPEHLASLRELSQKTFPDSQDLVHAFVNLRPLIEELDRRGAAAGSWSWIARDMGPGPTVARVRRVDLVADFTGRRPYAPPAIVVEMERAK